MRGCAIARKSAERLVGCATGAVTSLICLKLASDDAPLSPVCLFCAIWFAACLRGGTRGVAYTGAQFAIAFLVKFVRATGLPDSVMPPLDRLEGIVIGLGALALADLLWPLAPLTAPEAAALRTA